MTRAAAFLTSVPAFAHRGLWSPDGPPENSLPAFEAAALAGYGIELDVRGCDEPNVVVFHDPTLERMTGWRRIVQETCLADLQAERLAGTDARIPTLYEALEVIAGRVPVLIELKVRQTTYDVVERMVAVVLGEYDGPVAVIGFNPDALVRMREHAPEVLIGLNAAPHVNENGDVVASDPSRVLRHVDRVRPDFLSLGKAALAHGRPDTDLPIVAWTLRSTEDVAAVRPHCDAFMFEGFQP